MTTALQRCTVMRRAKEYELTKILRPSMPRLVSVITGAASDKPAHAVTHDHNFIQRRRPIPDQRLQHPCEYAAIASDREAAVIAQVERQIPEFFGKHRAMVVAIAIPLTVVHAKPVYKHQKSVSRGHIAASPEYAHRIVQVNALAAITQAHLDGQRVFGPQKIVAIHPVRHGSGYIQDRRGVALRQQWSDTCETGIDGASNETDTASNTAIHKARNPARAIAWGNAQRSWPMLYGAVDPLDDLGNCVCGVDCHTRNTAKIRQL